jgi:hypothetical protein
VANIPVSYSGSFEFHLSPKIILPEVSVIFSVHPDERWGCTFDSDRFCLAFKFIIHYQPAIGSALKTKLSVVLS